MSNEYTIDFKDIQPYKKSSDVETAKRFCLTDYPKLLNMANKMGIVITDDWRGNIVATPLCRLSTTGQVLVCYSTKRISYEKYYGYVRKLEHFLWHARADAVHVGGDSLMDFHNRVPLKNGSGAEFSITRDSVTAGYGHPIRLREYPQLLAMARKLGLVVSTVVPEDRMFTNLCKLELSGQTLVCYTSRPLNMDQIYRKVKKLFALLQTLRPDVVRAHTTEQFVSWILWQRQTLQTERTKAV